MNFLRKCFKQLFCGFVMIKAGEIPIAPTPKMDYGFASDEARNFLKRYQEKVNQYPEAVRNLLKDTFSVGDDGLIRGSSTLANIVARDCLSEGEVVLSVPQFGWAFNDKPKFFYNTYQDTGVILRTDGDSYEPNDQRAKSLFGQLKNRRYVASPENPVVVSLVHLDLDEDGNLVLREDAEPIQGDDVAEAYGEGAKVGKFTLYNERGIPIPDKDGKHGIYNRSAGLARVCSNCGQGAYSDGEHLANSGEYGRVVVGVGRGVLVQLKLSL